MRILALHQNKFERLAYDRAIDHSLHDVTYAGTAENIANIPAHVRCETFVWAAGQPVADQLRPWMRGQAPFDRILTRHELLIMPAAELRAEFGITGMQPTQALNFRDKVAMKTTLARSGLRFPRFIPADVLPAEVPWPGRVIVKPRDGAGSKGVYLCDDYQSACELVEARRRDDETFAGRHEVEEYLDGPIWHIDGYMFRGEAVAVQASRYIGTGLTFEHGAPLGSVQYANPELEAWAVECLRALGGETLTFHLEAIMTADGPAFMEVAARCGGGYIADMFRRRTGVYMHTIDMASDVDGELATRLIEAAAPSDFYGMFLYPCNTYGGAPCTVAVSDARLNDPCLISHRIFPPDTPTPTKGSYRPENLAFSGVVTGPDPDVLEKWICDLLAEVKVIPQPRVHSQ